MHYFAYVELAGFYALAWENRDPSRIEEPLAIHRDKHVIDANTVALAAGVGIGMAKDEAKLLLPSQGLIAWKEADYREEQAQWLDAAVRFSGIVEPDGQHAAWIDLRGHPDALQTAGELGREIEGVSGCAANVGISPVKWVAKLAGRQYGNRTIPVWEMLMQEAMERPGRFLSALPTGMLIPCETRTRERLKYLGYRTIGDVAEVPLSVLRAQFGQESMTIHRAARGGGAEAVHAEYPANALAVGRRYEGGIDGRQELDRALRQLAIRIALGLRNRDSHGTDLLVEIEFEAASSHRERKFSRPIRTAGQAFSALSRLSEGIEEPVWGIFIRIPNLIRCQERQSNLGMIRSSRHESAAAAAVARLQDAFGSDTVFRASERAEPRRIQVLRAWTHATGWR